MAKKIPVKARFSGSDVVALGEMEPGDTVDPAFLENGGGYPLYDNTVDYAVGTRRQGSDNNIYTAAIVNGPDSSVVDPVGDTTGTWELSFNTGYVKTTGTDTYLSPSLPTTPADKQVLLVNFGNTNTGASTLNGKAVKNSQGNDVVAGELTGNQTLTYDASNTWYVLDQVTTTGLVSTTVITSSTTYNPPANVKSLEITAIGGGGGGGGVDGQGSSTAASSGAGAAGATVVLTTSTIDTSYAVTIGAGGAGGPAGNNAGSNGGDTTVVSTNVNISAGGGTGGQGHIGTGGNSGGTGGTGGTGTGGDEIIDGGDASNGRTSDGTVGCYSIAGTSSKGGGGRSNTNATGQAGRAYGSGGGGSVNTGSTSNYGGGDGKQGVVIIKEYF